MKKKDKNIVEIKFNSKKEKIFIIMKEGLSISDYEQFLKMCDSFIRSENKVWILPGDLIQSIKVIKDKKRMRK